MSINEFNPQSNNCLICGSNRLHRFKAQAHDSKSVTFIDITECKNCIFAWQYPLRRTESQSLKFFEIAYADRGKTTTNYFNEDLKRDIAELQFDFVASLPGKNSTLLDIGAGAGIFAKVAAEKGWNVTAIDPAIDPDRFKRNPMITAIKGKAEKSLCNGVFDIITMWDVLEHAEMPVALIYTVKKYLKEDGWLVIETGNYKSGKRVNAGTRHWIYQFDHRWYFSPESVKSLLKRCGFSEFLLSDKVLRSDRNGNIDYRPSKLRLLKWTVKDPFRLPMHISKFLNTSKATKWEMSGIDVFTIAAKKG